MTQRNRNTHNQPISYWRSFTVLIVLEFFALALFYVVVILIRSSAKNTFIDVYFSLEAFEHDVLNSGFKTSLYDVMFIVLWRMLVLLVAYSACRSTSRIAIGLTVLVTTVYTAVKIILSAREEFGFPVVLEYAFMLISLIIHWITLILFEIAYRPAESRVSFPKGFLSYYDQYINKKTPIYQTIRDVDGVPAEREPLLNNHSNQPLMYEGSRIQISDRDEFHSPDQSLRGSPEPVHLPIPTRGAEPILLNEEDVLYKNTSEECIQIISNLISSNGWKMENKLNNTVCHSKQGIKGKIYKCQGELPVNATLIYNKLYDEVVYQSRWNPEVSEIQILKPIDGDTDLIYIVSSKPPGGMVQQR
ncbi:StAR-related lipid transfer protein 3 [Oopsacas minuta]|uniref:StAR-related lipid transfer protein 3 n=1 Tax=Oopsacas minuta TaxID=111878 RepID=A0AAV7JAU1_9METZ|nr:StAR-related lipid transfer protein 3 [Oopsacas minuta]